MRSEAQEPTSSASEPEEVTVNETEAIQTHNGFTVDNMKEAIAMSESGGDYNARNGRYIGRYQLDESYLNGDFSPENQERVFEQYVNNRYGSIAAAWEFWKDNGYY